MAKRGFNLDQQMSDTGNWNVAQPYVFIKVMRHLHLIDTYEELATFGTADILEDYQLTPDMISLNRLRAIKRLAKHLQMLMDNTKFAIKETKDKEKIKAQYETLLEVISYFPAIEKRVINQKTKQVSIEIKEDLFAIALGMLIKIKIEINEPLNNNDLIFSNIEEFDPEKYKDEMFKELTEVG